MLVMLDIAVQLAEFVAEPYSKRAVRILVIGVIAVNRCVGSGSVIMILTFGAIGYQRDVGFFVEKIFTQYQRIVDEIAGATLQVHIAAKETGINPDAVIVAKFITRVGKGIAGNTAVLVKLTIECTAQPHLRY